MKHQLIDQFLIRIMKILNYQKNQNQFILRIRQQMWHVFYPLYMHFIYFVLFVYNSYSFCQQIALYKHDIKRQFKQSFMEVTTQPNSTSIQLTVKYPSIPNLSFNFQMIITVYKQVLPSMTYQKQSQNSILFPKAKILLQNLQSGKMYKIELKCKSGGLKQSIIKNIFTFTKHGQEQSESSQQNEENHSQRSSYSLAHLARDNVKSYFEMYQQKEGEIKPYPDNNYDNSSERMLNSNRSSSNSSNPYNIQHAQTMKSMFQPSKITKTTFSNSQIMMKGIGQCSSFIKKSKVQKYLLEGRKCKNIDEFVNQKGKKYNLPKQRREILQKKILVAKGMDVFNQIYKQDEGMKFFKNDWFMGPFYSYDQNQKNIKR